MKYCPTCQTQFEGDEAFCPHDGTRLIDETNHQPGRLAGSSLQGIVNLEAFLFADHLGERYRGRLLSNNKHVRVTVFHRQFSSDRLKKAAALRDGLESPLPDSILSVHSVHGDQSPAFLVEEEAQLDTLARLLKKKGPLPWEQALCLTIKLARNLEWLVNSGIPVRSLHRRAIFVDHPRASPVEVGEWFVGLLTFPLPAIEADTPTNAIPVYPGYVAPEWLVDDEVDPQRAVVYSAGAVLLDALGQPIVDEEELSQKGLRNWLDDEGDDFEPSLPDDAPESLGALLDMMIARDPQKRFQEPAAAIRALASLIDEDPDKLAPPLEAAEAPAFDGARNTRPIALPDAETEGAEGADEEAVEKGAFKTAIGLPAQSMTAEEEEDDSGAGDTLPGDPPRVIADDPNDDPDDDALPVGSQAAESKDGGDDDEPGKSEEAQTEEEDDEDPPSTKETLMMGAVSVDDLAAKAAAEEEEVQSEEEEEEEEEEPVEDEETEPEESTKGSTLLMNTVKVDAVDQEAGDEEAGDEEKVADDDDQEPIDRSSGATVRQYHLGPDDESEKDDDEGDRDVEEEVDDDTEQDDDEDKPSIIIDESLSAESEEEQDKEEQDEEEQDEEEQEEDESSGKMEIGFVAAKQSSSEDVDDVFFGRSTEDAWEQSFVQESYERSERIARMTRIGMVIGGILVVVGAVIFFQAIYEPEEEEEIAYEYTGPEPLTGAELERVLERFDRAIEEDALLQPSGESAQHYLRELERRADSEIADEARLRFSRAADRLSRQREAAGDILAARNLSGHASSSQPDNEELKIRAEEVHERYLEAVEEARAAQEADLDGEEEERDDESDDDDAEEAEDADEAQPASAQRPTERAPAPSSSGVNVDQLLAEARAAQNARDDAKAREKFAAILEHQPSHAAANDGMGRLYFHDGQHRSALPHQRRAVQSAPRNIEYRLQLGMVLYRLGEYEEAIDVWNEVLDQDPDHRTVRAYIDRAERNLN